MDALVEVVNLIYELLWNFSVSLQVGMVSKMCQRNTIHQFFEIIATEPERQVHHLMWLKYIMVFGDNYRHIGVSHRAQISAHPRLPA